jgi:hypothetical protein
MREGRDAIVGDSTGVLRADVLHRRVSLEHVDRAAG